MVLNIEGMISGANPSALVLTTNQMVTVFYPNDESGQAGLLRQMNEAIGKSDLLPFPTDGGDSFVCVTHLAAWPDCPALPSNSPLNAWLPHLQSQKEPSEMKTVQQCSLHDADISEAKQRKKRASWQDELPYISEIYLSTQQTGVKGLWRELKAKADKDDSPFIVGKGIDRDKLVVKKTGATLMEHTLETNMGKVRGQASKSN